MLEVGWDRRRGNELNKVCRGEEIGRGEKEDLGADGSREVSRTAGMARAEIVWEA